MYYKPDYPFCKQTTRKARLQRRCVIEWTVVRRMRAAWALGGAGAAAVGLAAYWYAHRVERVRVSLHRATVEVDKPGLPPDGLTILHLSDFHFRRMIRSRRRACDGSARCLQPSTTTSSPSPAI